MRKVHGGTSRLRKTIVSYASRMLLRHVFTYVYPFIFSTSSHPCSFRKQPLYYNSLADQLTFETFNLLARTTCSKYVVTATIMQKNGAGVHSANALWVDPSNDGIVTVKWPTDKKGDGNRTMYCIVNVLALNF